MKRRTRKQWYQYHLARAQDLACEQVFSMFAAEIKNIEEAEANAQRALREATRNESIWSGLASLFGHTTSYRRDYIIPLLEALRTICRARDDLLTRRQSALFEARKIGENTYISSRDKRRSEAAARAARVAAKKDERRIRYLERSPAIRSAARFFRKLLINEATKERDFVICYYCRCEIAPFESHLEHKRPVSRGGGNQRSNLVLSCSSCNLRKGKKTHEEFTRTFKNNE
jgi:5-methylcytosine-specific restriction endonuclease McrA